MPIDYHISQVSLPTATHTVHYRLPVGLDMPNGYNLTRSFNAFFRKYNKTDEVLFYAQRLEDYENSLAITRQFLPHYTPPPCIRLDSFKEFLAIIGFNNTHKTWSPPFSLNLPELKPYCLSECTFDQLKGLHSTGFYPHYLNSDPTNFASLAVSLLLAVVAILTSRQHILEDLSGGVIRGGTYPQYGLVELYVNDITLIQIRHVYDSLLWEVTIRNQHFAGHSIQSALAKIILNQHTTP